ncbi:hypothetical protein HRR83_008148 [Exophiala dermatitidis]|uniref:Minichromosome maintenance protein 10 n=2 Tax=Exophiala dermatitidis TaxID=5970 RepID=H6BT25_EXODN|nr:minichromosome maintenance protein 10 [Exophiala dermatitidis NIH/UT8656]KAJ4505865.1 hypothetical protein HRR75_007246 [Exophiala dermatitidis]EHY54275.1 minichromosome maintenance protein 10 [Exophiala dermatitidis NIH/UT8656]KAJ4508013.1 hypothetical protein HRR74_007898 [Exophiala dermatitidis]KAJ4513578.1 hypothetical protein HRR73_005736 [Exophiala dermatitidis]KAJ4535580.1 hypothetical protein HRR77_007898 [Exophiala dermatitidis]
MSHEIPWPPESPKAALLSSPSGRRRYDAQISRSPIKRSATTPNLLDRLRAARKDKEHFSMDENMDDDLEEDEETLQLKLAAIEAKLKLKKLQQNKAKAATAGKEPLRPSSAQASTSAFSDSASEPAKVEVKVSPAKRAQPVAQQRSPSRVLLGIDKGVRGSDISLRRANTTAGATHARGEVLSSRSDRPSSRSSAFSSARSAVTAKSALSEGNSMKTFSERMAEARQRVKAREEQRETTSRIRGKGFELDQAEIERYKSAAIESRSHEAPKSPVRQLHSEAYSREDIVNATKQGSSSSRRLEKSQANLGSRASPSRPSSRNSPSEIRQQADASLFEGYSQLHLSSRILPHSFLKRTLAPDRFTIYRVPDLLREIKSPEFELPDGVCDYVVCGVIASKSSPMDHKTPAPDSSTVGTKDWEQQWDDGSKNQRRFMVLTLTDLKWTVDLYLFGTALPRYHRLTPGTVVAILNPGIMPPKSGKTDTGAFSLTLSSGDDTVLEIGTARDLGYCKTLKKDGKECGSWLDSSKTEICEWHLNAELNKARATRMGVNTGTNGFGGTGPGSRRFFDKNVRSSNRQNGLQPQDGHRYDRWTGSHYYIAKSNTGPAPGAVHAARGHGGLGVGFDDDPFIPEGKLTRDRDARLRKHFAVQEKEREIAEKLGSGKHAGFGGAGAEYLRQKAKSRAEASAKESSTNTRGPEDNQPSRSNSAVSRTHILGKDANDASASGTGAVVPRKRTAADVRLSPVKKTRFVTSKGIKEAGRESLGVAAAPAPDEGSGSDDDLEII